MRKTRLIMLILIVMATMLILTPTSAQQPTNPNATITWPPPVYVLRGQFIVRGSANLPNMSTYYLEYRPRGADLSTPVGDGGWAPATLPSRTAIQDGVLGSWDTTLVNDGVYDLRLVVNAAGGTPTFAVVGPLRIENTPSPFAATPVPLVPTALPTQQIVPTLLPTPTAFDPTPRVTAIRNANIRSGDGTNYDVIAGLSEGQSAPIVGVSGSGSGWYAIRLPSGVQGWIAPSVVTVSGDLRNTPRLSSPPTPTPLATATPVATVNLVAGNFSFVPGSPKCAQTFNVFMDVANFGTTTSPSGIIGVTDFRVADGTQQGSTIGAFPPIAPGQTINVGPIPLTISTWYNEQHRLLIVLDPSNLIAETNKSDNAREAIYVLEKAGCP